MSEMNPLWGAPRIHRELLKLGIAVSHGLGHRKLPVLSRPQIAGFQLSTEAVSSESNIWRPFPNANREF